MYSPTTRLLTVLELLQSHASIPGIKLAETLEVRLQLAQQRSFRLGFRAGRFSLRRGFSRSGDLLAFLKLLAACCVSRWVIAHFLRITIRVMSSCCGCAPTNSRRSSVRRVITPAAPSEALARIAAERGVSRALIALAWLRRNPVVVAPIVGASKAKHIDDAIAALSIELTDEEANQLEAHYTPRYDTQGISDPKQLAAIMARVGLA